ncbi:hypothetical protein Barb7_02158 [Bacteroidales bacterium Barb7]|nr:hypothetical protein Barb7_02158 [Bacteroidales bacterium Barb7]
MFVPYPSAHQLLIAGDKEIGGGDEVGMNQQGCAGCFRLRCAKQQGDAFNLPQGKRRQGRSSAIDAFFEKAGRQDSYFIAGEISGGGCVTDC